MSSYMYFDKDGIIVESSVEQLPGVPWITGLDFGHIILHQPLPVADPDTFGAVSYTHLSGGIEQFYNDQLIGTNGREYGYLDAESNMEKVIKSAENGNTIVSTIDTNIQKIVEKYIDEWMNGIGSKTAAVLVMNPNNGEILAMACLLYTSRCV